MKLARPTKGEQHARAVVIISRGLDQHADNVRAPTRADGEVPT